MTKIPHAGVNQPETTPKRPMKEPQPMALTEQERAELVEELAEAIYAYDDNHSEIGIETWPNFCKKVGEYNDYKYWAGRCLPIIERLLAERDVDALLDIDRVLRKFGSLQGQILEMKSNLNALQVEIERLEDYIRTAAIAAAVQRAKEQGNE